MAARYHDIELALIQGVKEADPTNTAPMGYPNAILSPTERGDGLWLQLHNVRGLSQPVTLGQHGEDNHTGFLQIDISFPENKGTYEVLQKADKYASYFTAGKDLVYNAQNVKVLSTSLSNERYVGGYYRISLTVNYYSRTQRNF